MTGNSQTSDEDLVRRVLAVDEPAAPEFHGRAHAAMPGRLRDPKETGS